MSFSGEVKEELVKQIGAARHCQIAEIAAITSLCGHLKKRENQAVILEIHTENESVLRKYFTLLKKTFKIKTEIVEKQSPYLHKKNIYMIQIEKQEDIQNIFQAAKLQNIVQNGVMDISQTSNMIVQHSCCKRAFIRGAFLAAGSISDPAKSYHFEIVCPTMEKAEQLRDIISSFELDAKIVIRKKYFVVYLKEGAQIVEILGVMEANVALLNLENVRILKDMRNSLNRQVNCEAANINKTVSAAVKQIEDIKYIRDTIGFSELSKGLEDMAKLRLEYSDVPLKELGKMLSPPVGKSGVNHRLRKLSSIAEELRGKQGGRLL
ncbi:MAG: DNA-binding protein WhiA [Lachnospiraceae bacterium]|nr:DNA-binding protein WhiA [Lachnospiraceae bacterium]MDD3616889.1 DNA-binding protein WhiA [Lachnospiraceae bacterium]